MVNLNGKLVVIGGSDGIGAQDSLHELACYNSYCFWQEMEQKLKNGREDFVAIAVPDAFVDCCDTSKNANQYEYQLVLGLGGQT